MPTVTSLQTQQQDQAAVAAALRAALRTNPDFIVIGEVRDAAALRADAEAARNGRVTVTVVPHDDGALP